MLFLLRVEYQTWLQSNIALSRTLQCSNKVLPSPSPLLLFVDSLIIFSAAVADVSIGTFIFVVDGFVILGAAIADVSICALLFVVDSLVVFSAAVANVSVGACGNSMSLALCDRCGNREAREEDRNGVDKFDHGVC